MNETPVANQTSKVERSRGARSPLGGSSSTWAVVVLLLPLGRALETSDAHPILRLGRGATLTRTLDSTWTMSTSNYHASLTRGSNTEQFHSLPHLEAERSIHLGVIDKYEDGCTSRPARVSRELNSTLYSIRQSAPLMGDGQEVVRSDQKGLFHGATIAFNWSDSEGRFICSVGKDRTFPSDSLLGLSEDMDYTCILPSKSMAVGDSWSIDPGHLKDLVTPGGDCFPISATPPRPAEGERKATINFGLAWLNMFGPEVFGSPKGSIDAKLTECRDTGPTGRSCVIHVDMQLSTSADVSEMMKRLIEEGIPTGKHYEYSHTIVCSLSGGGDVVWDMDENHMHSVSIILDATTKEEFAFGIDGKSDSGEIVPTHLEWFAEWSGRLRVEGGSLIRK